MKRRQFVSNHTVQMSTKFMKILNEEKNEFHKIFGGVTKNYHEKLMKQNKKNSDICNICSPNDGDFICSLCSFMEDAKK